MFKSLDSITSLVGIFMNPTISSNLLQVLEKVSTTTLTHNNDNEWYIYLRNKDTMSQSLPPTWWNDRYTVCPEKVSL